MKTRTLLVAAMSGSLISLAIPAHAQEPMSITEQMCLAQGGQIVHLSPEVSGELLGGDYCRGVGDSDIPIRYP